MSNRAMLVSADFSKDWEARPRRRSGGRGLAVIEIASTFLLATGATVLIAALCGNSLLGVGAQFARIVSFGAV